MVRSVHVPVQQGFSRSLPLQPYTVQFISFPCRPPGPTHPAGGGGERDAENILLGPRIIFLHTFQTPLPLQAAWTPASSRRRRSI